MGWLLLIAALAGFVLVTDYGMSVDEYANAEVGAAALDVYRGRPEAYFSRGEVLAHHGPAYFMLFSISSRLLAAVVPGWVAADGRHLTNFLTFLLSAGALFALSRRWLRPALAWLTVALFLTQPLLFGYGFVNQKDVPFMAAFLLIVATGMASGDRLATPASSLPSKGSSGWRQQGKMEWQRLRPASRVLLLGLLALTGLALLDQWVFGWSSSLAQSVTTVAYLDRGGPLLSRLFANVAANASAVPLEAYLAKLQETMSLAALPLGVVSITVALIALGAAFPLTARQLFARHAYWLGPVLVGALLGFAVSIRPIGAFAGALVSLFWILRLKRRSWAPLLTLWLAGAAVAVLGWPYVWADPVRNLWQSLQLTANFPAHDMLYRGLMISSDALPWHFFPTLAAIQLTEPVLPLVLAGMGIFVWRWWRRRMPWEDAIIISLWFGIPLFALLFLGFGIYGNIRQLLFVLPPLFVLAGLTLDVILRAVPMTWGRWALATVVLLPGIVGIVRMHPYEHAYFNLYAGGEDGAWGDYQPSHWCTPLRDATEYVNQVAPFGSLILVDGPVEGVRAFARADLVVDGVWSGIENPAFVLSCIRTPDELHAPEGMVEVYQVRRGKAIFALVFEPTLP